MARTFKVWLDSGANAFSCFKTTVTLEELGISDDFWDGMNEQDRDAVMRDVAFSQAEWGFRELV